MDLSDKEEEEIGLFGQIEKEAKPLLKWTGGKSRLLDSIVPTFLNKSMLGKNKKYIEPFAGSCSVAFYLNCDKMILNDKNIKLMNFYTQVKTRPDKLYRKINKLVDAYKLSSSKKKQEAFFYKVRDSYNGLCLTEGNGLVHASLFWFINKTCFNGMYREKKDGAYNIPFGKRDCPEPKLDNFLSVSEILQKCELYHKPFEAICEMAEPYDVVYLDPPYIPVSKTSSFSGYLRYGFDENDHKRLCKIMQTLSDNNVTVVLSNSSCQSTLDIYGGLVGFHHYKVEVHRTVSGTNKGRGKIKELIITNREKK